MKKILNYKSSKKQNSFGKKIRVGDHEKIFLNLLDRKRYFSLHDNENIKYNMKYGKNIFWPQ